MIEYDYRVYQHLLSYNCQLMEIHDRVWQEAQERLFLRDEWIKMTLSRHTDDTETTIRVVTGKLVANGR